MTAEKFGQTFLSATLFVIVFFGFYFVFNEFKSSGEKDLASSDTVDIRKVEQKIDDAVNRNLKNIDSERRMRELAISAENSKLSSSFRSKANKWNPEPPQQTTNPSTFDIDLSQGNIEPSDLSVEERLRLQMESRKKASYDAERQKREYIEAYKKNALRDGWIVEINDDLEIISAKRVDE